MEKSLTWIRLSDKEWLLVCVGYIVPFSLKDENELIRQGIGIQDESGSITTSSYTWRSVRIWRKDGQLTENDKLQVESALNEKNNYEP